jgi:hypothetical protein
LRRIIFTVGSLRWFVKCGIVPRPYRNSLEHPAKGKSLVSLDKVFPFTYYVVWVILSVFPQRQRLAGVFTFWSSFLELRLLFATLTKHTGFCRIAVPPSQGKSFRINACKASL